MFSFPEGFSLHQKNLLTVLLIFHNNVFLNFLLVFPIILMHSYRVLFLVSYIYFLLFLVIIGAVIRFFQFYFIFPFHGFKELTLFCWGFRLFYIPFKDVCNFFVFIFCTAFPSFVGSLYITLSM